MHLGRWCGFKISAYESAHGACVMRWGKDLWSKEHRRQEGKKARKRTAYKILQEDRRHRRYIIHKGKKADGKLDKQNKCI